MDITVATAPCCWGVDDPTRPDLPDWTRVLAEAAAAGYAGIELGPWGYLPPDPARVGGVLAAHGLGIVAGTIFDDLVTEARRAALVERTRAICALLVRLPRPPRGRGWRHPAPYLTIIDWGHAARDRAAGRSESAPRLSADAWAGMMATIRAIATVARDEFGVRAVVHPHAGGYIEFQDEIDRLAADIPADVAGICIDTGHSYYAGIDPLVALRRYWDRIDYIHFKDIDRAVFDRVTGERVLFFEACAQGVMCPIGRGVIDYPAIRAFLAEKGYGGFVTVEQERDPRNAGGSLADVKASRDYLKGVGY